MNVYKYAFYNCGIRWVIIKWRNGYLRPEEITLNLKSTYDCEMHQGNLET